MKNMSVAETPVSGDFIRTFSLSLHDIAVKSTTSASGEFSINEATVFVYQTDGSTGIESLYDVIHTDSESIDVPLLFNGQTEYTYRFEAYANMGEKTQEPSEVLFSQESAEGFQMHGTLDGIGQSTATEAVVPLERYAGRVIVESVKLSWKQSENSSQDFTLKRLWLENTAETYGGAASYNLGGTYTECPMDQFLLSEVNQVIGNGSSYDISHYLYGYGAEGSALVLECEWAGRTMYYHLDCELASNRSMNYRLTIHQTGAETPLGEITDDALTNAGSLSATEWVTGENKVSFGEEKYPGTTELPEKSAMILRTNGRLYTPTEWNEMDIDDAEAVGVAFSDGTHSLVVHPKQGYGKWSSASSIPDFEGKSLINVDTEAALDFSGKANTDAILAAVGAGILADAPAAQYAADITFANGKKGYLPSAGEMKMIAGYWGGRTSPETRIYKCMEAIGGDLEVNGPICSTLNSNLYCWAWLESFAKISTDTVTRSNYYFIVCEY